MCIAVIKKSNNIKYSYFIAFNRDESIEKKWKTWGYHWVKYPNIFGFLDIDTQGTWLARNDYGVVAFLLNRESENTHNLLTRAYIVLHLLNNAKTAVQAIEYANKYNISNIKPFNLVAVDRENVVYISNCQNEGKGKILKESLIIINRSYPNDFNEIRIKRNYPKFEHLAEPDPEKKYYSFWESVLKECSFLNGTKNEFSMSLVSKSWRTLSSSIITIKKDGTMPIIYDLRLEEFQNGI